MEDMKVLNKNLKIFQLKTLNGILVKYFFNQGGIYEKE